MRVLANTKGLGFGNARGDVSYRLSEELISITWQMARTRGEDEISTRCVVSLILIILHLGSIGQRGIDTVSTRRGVLVNTECLLLANIGEGRGISRQRNARVLVLKQPSGLGRNEGWGFWADIGPKCTCMQNIIGSDPSEPRVPKCVTLHDIEASINLMD